MSDDLRSYLGEQADRLFADHCTRELREAAEAGEFPTALWDVLEQAGFAAVLVPEDEGGSGAGWPEAEVLLRAAGRHAAPVPLAETLLAGWLLGRNRIAVPPGPITIAPTRPGAGLSLVDGRLSGTAERVPWGRAAGNVLVAVGNQVALLETTQAEVEPDTNMAGEPRDTLRFADAAPLAVATDDALTTTSLWQLGALIRAGQIAGALQASLAMAVQYANDRVQFGRPIGKFQAVQQSLAELAGEVAAASAAVGAACERAALPDAGFEIAVAKQRASEAAGIACRTAHQTHGAIGFTHEYALHPLTRRLWSWRAEFGNDAHWAAELGRFACGRGADALWPFLTDRTA
ncbi:MAG: acyl-CoA dehydrogenase family protein [Alphaproteobacteria bacterium]